MMTDVTPIPPLDNEFAARTAERDRAQRACEQMGERLSVIADIEAELREQASGSQDGYLLDVANRIRTALTEPKQ